MTTSRQSVALDHPQAESSHNKQDRAGLQLTVPFSERLACTIREASIASGLGPTTLYSLIADGTLKSVKIGRRRLVVVESLRQLVLGDAAVGG